MAGPAGMAAGETCGSSNSVKGVNGCNFLGKDGRCKKPATQEEILMTTSRVNGDAKPHLIQSTGSCTGTLDFQLEDTTTHQGFAGFFKQVHIKVVGAYYG